MVAFSLSSRPSHQHLHNKGRKGRTDIGYLFSDRYFDAWAFLLDDRPDNLFVLRCEINRRVNCRNRYSLDTLLLDLCTYTSDFVRIDLKSA
jgi:hypothetical protein